MGICSHQLILSMWGKRPTLIPQAKRALLLQCCHLASTWWAIPHAFPAGYLASIYMLLLHLFWCVFEKYSFNFNQKRKPTPHTAMIIDRAKPHFIYRWHTLINLQAFLLPGWAKCANLLFLHASIKEIQVVLKDELINLLPISPWIKPICWQKTVTYIIESAPHVRLILWQNQTIIMI